MGKLHLRSSLNAFLKLIRASNLLILAFTQYIIAIFLIGPKKDWLQILTNPGLFCLVLSTVLIAAGGYIINDYYDVKIDIINKPKRVIIGRALKRRIAMISHTIFNVLGIILGLLAGFKIGIIAFSAAFLLWLYSNSLKRLPLTGNLVVSILTALSILLVPIYFERNMEIVIIYAIFAFVISIVREIIKDMEDQKGDSAFGCETLPIAIGIRKTKIFIYSLIAIFLTILLLLGYKLNQNIILYFLILIFPSVIFLVLRLFKSDNSKDFHFLSRLCKFIMIGGVISMLFI